MRLVNFNLAIGTQLFKAMSEEPRIRITNLLHEFGPLTISDLEMVLDYTQAKTSRHITYLKNSGILSIQKIDQWSLYQIKKEFSDVINQFLKYLDKDPILLKDSEICHNLKTNRELSSSKLKIRK